MEASPGTIIPLIVPLTLFRVRDFRYLGASVLLNSVGMMGENVVLGWLTLELTNSPFMVGAVSAVRMAPQVPLGIPDAFFYAEVDGRPLRRGHPR